MKIILILFKIIVLVLLLSYILLKYVISTQYTADAFISADEKSARNNGRLCAKYTIGGFDNILIDSLKKYKYEALIDTMSFFIEKGRYYHSEKVFLTRELVADNFLVYRSPFLGSCDNIKKYHDILGEGIHPDLIFMASFEDSSKISNYRRSYEAIYLQKYDLEEYLPKEIDMFCFFGRLEQTNFNFSYLGKVKLKQIEKYDIPNSSELKFSFLYPTNIPKLQLECW